METNLFDNITKLLGKEIAIDGRTFSITNVSESNRFTKIATCVGDDGEQYICKIISTHEGYDHEQYIGDFTHANTVLSLSDASLLNQDIIAQHPNEVVVVSKYRGIDLGNYRRNKAEHDKIEPMGASVKEETCGRVVDDNVQVYHYWMPFLESVRWFFEKFLLLVFPKRLPRKSIAKNELYICEFMQIFSGINHALLRLHSVDIIHRDVKPENIFISWMSKCLSENNQQYLNEIDVILGDFGIATTVDTYRNDNEGFEDENTTPIGTRGFIAPECVHGQTCLKSDIFSFGRTMLCLLCPEQYSEKHLEGMQSFLFEKSVNELIELWSLEQDVESWSIIFELLKSMLHTDPNQRPSCNDIFEQIYSGKFSSFSGFNKLQFHFSVLPEPFKKNINMQLLSLSLGTSLMELNCSNKLIVLEAVKQNWRSFQFAKGEVTRDKDFITTTLKQWLHELSQITVLKNEIKDDLMDGISRVIKLTECKDDFPYGFLDNFIPYTRTPKNDTEFYCLMETRSFFEQKQELPDFGKLSEKDILMLIQNNPDLFKKIDNSLKSDRLFALEAIKKNQEVFQLLDETMKTDKEFIFEAIAKNERVLDYISKEWMNDRIFILKAVRQNAYSLQYASDNLKNDKLIALEAIKNNPTAILFISETLKNDRDVQKIMNEQKKRQNYNQLVVEAISYRPSFDRFNFSFMEDPSDVEGNIERMVKKKRDFLKCLRFKTNHQIGVDFQ